LLVETADELLGVKNYYFKVSVKQANQLPKNLSKNAFVTYQFKFDKGESYQTKETNNKDGGNIHFWNYDKVHCIEEVTPTIIQEIKEGSISFQIYAYPPSNVQLPKEDGGAAIKKRMTMRNGPQMSAAEEAKLLKTDEGKKDFEVTYNENAIAKSPPKSPSKNVQSNFARK